MSPGKTRAESGSATEFVARIPNAQKRADSLQLLELMRATTGIEPVMWGSSIVGCGTHHYRYESGREGDTVAVGFAPRAEALVLYGVHEENQDLAASLGTHSTGKGCLYVKRLSDVDLGVLQRMIKKSFAARNNAQPSR